MAKIIGLSLLLIIVVAISIWFGDNDGSVMVEWMGYKIQTSVSFAILSLAIAFILFSIILQIFLVVKNSPKRFLQKINSNNHKKGLESLTCGFSAIASGDNKLARKLAKKAANYLGIIPLTKLLNAQSAELDGNVQLANSLYNSLLDDKETKMIAIKGLLLRAHKDGDFNKALFLAQKAYETNKDSSWAKTILLDLYKNQKKWEEAANLILKSTNRHNKEELSRPLAVIYLAMNEDANLHSDKAISLINAQKAYKTKPDFIPAIIAYGRSLILNGDLNKAIKIIRKSWQNEPSDQIAEIYFNQFSDNNDKLIKAAERLAKMNPAHRLSYFYLAKVSYLVGDLEKASNYLKIILSNGDTENVCNLMAQILVAKRASLREVEEWQMRAQNASMSFKWICSNCGSASQTWHVYCGNCSAFDAMKLTDEQNHSFHIPQNLDLLTVN